MHTEPAEGAEGRRYLSVEAFRRKHHLGRTLTWGAIWRGELPHVRIGRRVLIPEDALDQMLADAAKRRPADVAA